MGKKKEQAVVQAGAGNKQATLDNLERAFRDHDLNLLYVAFDPRFDTFRGERRFQELMEKIGITTAQ
ncbi:MAG: TPR end-of-group domain-containing protein [Longimicrobiales bacterium]